MSHLPYETWMFSQEQLSSEQSKELSDHLENCAQCRMQQLSWTNVRSHMQSAPVLPPRPGFSQRWQTGLSERRAREQLRQVRIWLLGLAAPAVTSLIVLGIYLTVTISPMDLVVAGFQSFTRMIIIGANLQIVLAKWVPILPIAIPVAIWILFSLSLCLVTGIWLVSMWQSIMKGVSGK